MMTSADVMPSKRRVALTTCLVFLLFMRVDTRESSAQETFLYDIGVSPDKVLPYQGVRYFVYRSFQYGDNYTERTISFIPKLAVNISSTKLAMPVASSGVRASIFEVRLPSGGRALTAGKRILLAHNDDCHIYSDVLSLVTRLNGESKEIPDIITHAVFPMSDEYRFSFALRSESPEENSKPIGERAVYTLLRTVQVSELNQDDSMICKYIRADHLLARAILAPTEDVAPKTRDLCLELLKKYPKSGYADDLHLAIARSYLHGTGYRPYQAGWQEEWEAKHFDFLKRAAESNQARRPELSREYDPGYTPSRDDVITGYLDQAYAALQTKDETLARAAFKKYSAWRWPNREQRQLAQTYLDKITNQKFAYYTIARMMSALNEQELTGTISKETQEKLLAECIADQEFQTAIQLFNYPKDVTKNLIPSMNKYYESHAKELFPEQPQKKSNAP